MSISVAESALLADPDRVEMVLRRVSDGHYRAAGPDGWCEFVRHDDGFDVVGVGGRDPLADQAVDRFLGLSVEAASLLPHRTTNAYPYAFDQIAQLFDHRDAPDLMVIRTAAFHVHGNMGEHGSLGAVQSRAAFLAGGKGIRADGIVDRHLRAVDVAPTMAAVLGCRPLDDGSHFGVQDGRVADHLLDGETAGRVLAFLFDGLNANLLLDALEAGDVPNIARIVEMGTCHRHGSLASLPTVTLPNHTTLLTGAHPGHHGVLSNSWFQRATGETPDLLGIEHMIRACDFLVDGVETLHEVIRRTYPDAFTATTYEYCDRGADWSTYGQMRAGAKPAGIPKKSDPVPHASHEWFESSPDYHFMSRIDTASTHQACALLAPDREHPLPTFLWVNYSLTDSAGHHAGPHGDEARQALIDTDARLGEVLAAADRVGALDDAAIFVLADHGMEQTDPAVVGHYRVQLDAAGLDYHDVDDGLIYLR